MPRYGKNRPTFKAKSASNQESEVSQIARAYLPQGLVYCAKKILPYRAYLFMGYFTSLLLTPTEISAVPAPIDPKFSVLNWHLMGTNFAHFGWNKKTFTGTSGPNTEDSFFEG